MHTKITAHPKNFRHIIIIAFITALLLLSVFALAYAEPNTPQSTTQSPVSTFTFTLNSGESTAPEFYFGAATDINFSLSVAGTSNSSEATMDISNASSSNIWSDTAYANETVWGNVTVTKGNNKFNISNSGPDTLTFTLKLFNIPTIQAPTPTYSWVGSADPDGLNSEIEINFPVSGLYNFDFTVNGGERFVFLLGSNGINRTVTANDSVSLYVQAGVQTLTLDQATAGNLVDWQVDIAYSGNAANALPYSQLNDAIDTEILPIHLAAAAQVNMVITATGTAGDQLLVNIVNATPQLATASNANISVYAGETTWTTFDLPAGTSSIELATPDGLMGYEFEIDIIPATDYGYAGVANPSGQNSKIRLTFGTAGLYDFDFGNDNGRYQFLLNVNDGSHIQKTIETNDTVTYYVPAGTHDLIVDQDAHDGAEWGVDISLNTASNNSLPYAQAGGEIGGNGNGFSTEWIPLSLSTAITVNMSITATGNTADHFAVEVYQSGDNTADYTLTQVLGSEEQWTNFQLSSGINRLKIVADGSNNAKMSYDLEISAVPTTGNMSWSGNVLDNGLEAAVRVDFPTTGLYRFNIDSAVGFANLVLDDHMVSLAKLNAPTVPSLGTSYDLQVNAGSHEIYVVQDNSYPNTTWTASVAPSTAEPKFFEFIGSLDSAESVTPIYTVPTGVRDFNFELEVSGNDVDLEISNSNGVIWSGTAIDGETLWGTGTLSGTNELMITNSSGAIANVSLKLYDIPTAGYAWDGEANSAGMNSVIRINFPQDGLYNFNAETLTGDFQFLVNSDFIQKTVPSSSDVDYFVPAGTHRITVTQETASDVTWSLAIANVGDSHDSLPYEKIGGQIGGTGNDFDTEWLPINLSGATEVNIATVINGTTGDDALLTVIDANSNINTLTVNAGETTWTTLDLPAGTSRFKLEAPGNTGGADYELYVEAIPSAANYNWDGNAIDIGENSHVRVSFPTSGVYSFTQSITAGNGRFQFLINSDFVQKTVETSETTTYYIPAGTHDLYIDQDSTDGAAWDVAMSGPIATMDSLPYSKMGGEIGGIDNDFTEEWLPVHVGTDTPVNAVVTITGDEADAVSIEIWNASTKVETVGPVYGTESLWATFTLPADGRINVVATGNTTAVSYEVEIIEIPSPTFSWNGTSLKNGEYSVIDIDIQVGGIYSVTGAFLEGFAAIAIDPSSPVTILNNAPLGVESDFNMTVPLDAGTHTFVVMQGSSFDTSTWAYTVTLKTANAPTISTVTPNVIGVGKETTITIQGGNFLLGAVVTLLGDTDYPLVTTHVNGSTLTAVVPATVDIDLYDVKVTNPDTQNATLADGLEVIEYYTFLPIIIKN